MLARALCILVFIVIIAPLIPISGPAAAQGLKERDPFPDFRMGPQNLGFLRADLPLDNTTLWVTRLGSPVVSSPVVTAGRLYFGTLGGQVLCLSATSGTILWEVDVGAGVESTAAVVNGSVYIGADDGLLRCLDAMTGEERWNYTTQAAIKSSPTVVEGRVYIGSNDFSVYCLDALTGAQLWNLSTGSFVYSSPAYLDGRIYFGSCDGKVYAVHASNGTVNWTFQAQYAPASPAVFPGGVVLGTYDRTFYQLDRENGDVFFSMRTRSEVYSSASVNTLMSPALVCTCDNEGNIYFMQGNHEMTSPVIEQDGPITSSPVLFGGYEGDGIALVVATKIGQIVTYEYMYEGPGTSRPYLEELWRLKLGTSITSTPFSYHGRLYVGAEDGEEGLVACIGVLEDEGRITVHSPAEGTHLLSPVNVSFSVEGVNVDYAEVVVGDATYLASETGGIWHVTVPTAATYGSTRLLVRAWEAGVTLAESSVEVNLRDPLGSRPMVTIAKPVDHGRVKGTFVASGSASGDPLWPVQRVVAVWDDEDFGAVATGTSNWAVALNCSGLGEGKHVLVVWAFDGLYWGESSVSLLVDNDESFVVGLADIVAIILLLTVVAVLILTRPKPPPRGLISNPGNDGQS